ncbi:hypothetical protein HQ590_02665 [bacterium]|nr:hypothetical protein [bacterium]
MIPWQNVLTLDTTRTVRAGCHAVLAAAISRGADLRIHTDFRHNEHIDTGSDNPELVMEVSEFRAIYLVDRRWVGGIMTLRQPVQCPTGFGPRASLSLFLYNQDGHQAVARLHLDGPPANNAPGASTPEAPANMPRYHALEAWDAGTNAPSQNFIYDFDCYEFFVRDDWQEVLAHDADGKVVAGSIEALTDAFRRGAELKVGVRNLCGDLADPVLPGLDHEVFVQAFSGYYYTRQGLFFVGTHPLARVRPAIPLRYVSGGWDYAWLFVRTDGFVETLRYDPYTLQTTRPQGRFAVRWFVR